MRHLRRLRGGPTPATIRARTRQAPGPQPRRKPPFFLRMVATPAAVVYVESIVELIVLTHRTRTNQAPLATGRYRR